MSSSSTLQVTKGALVNYIISEIVFKRSDEEVQMIANSLLQDRLYECQITSDNLHNDDEVL